MRKSRWPSWAAVPNKPMVSVDVKQHSTITMSANGDISTFSFSDELESPFGVPFKHEFARTNAIGGNVRQYYIDIVSIQGTGRNKRH